jgi:hypothetical protein
MLIFIAGTSAGFYLCKLSYADLIVCAIFAVVFLVILILGFLFHLGVSDFQEFEQ